MPVAISLAAALPILIASCSEEDRRAWVSILPLPEAAEDEGNASGTPLIPGELALGADSTAVLLGTDTLFTLDRLPGMSLPLRRSGRSAGFRLIALSPDSSAVGFTTGAGERVGVWSRRLQLARVADSFPAGRADTIAWSADGRYIAYAGTTKDGVVRTGIHDAVLGLTLENPVTEWLARSERSIHLQGWIDAGPRLRVLVAPGSAPEGGLPHVWDAPSGSFVAEAHIAPLAGSAPAGARLDPEAVFSVDLLGDGAPETIALYRSAVGAPGALVLESRGSEFRARETEPLVSPETLGLDGWGEQRGRPAPSPDPALHLVTRIGGRTTLVLRLPSTDAPFLALGLFQAGPDGRLGPVRVVTAAGERPAIFYDGQSSMGTTQLGLVDLNGDGGLEVISATGRLVAGAPSPEVAWQAVVFRASAGRLVLAPELESAALARIAEATSGISGEKP